MAQFHCHDDHHVMLSMQMAFSVKPSQLPPIPKKVGVAVRASRLDPCGRAVGGRLFNLAVSLPHNVPCNVCLCT
jgi:hypothetical protein